MRHSLPLERIGVRGLVYRHKLLSQCLGDGTLEFTSVLHPGETKINFNSVSVESIQWATFHLITNALTYMYSVHCTFLYSYMYSVHCTFFQVFRCLDGQVFAYFVGAVRKHPKVVAVISGKSSGALVEVIFCFSLSIFLALFWVIFRTFPPLFKTQNLTRPRVQEWWCSGWSNLLEKKMIKELMLTHCCCSTNQSAAQICNSFNFFRAAHLISLHNHQITR